jgi:hypothetical protein
VVTAASQVQVLASRYETQASMANQIAVTLRKILEEMYYTEDRRGPLAEERK